MKPNGQTLWLIDFLLETDGLPACKCVWIAASSIALAIEYAEGMIREHFPDKKFFVHNAGLADGGTAGKFADDPLGWDFEDLEKWEWQ